MQQCEREVMLRAAPGGMAKKAYESDRLIQVLFDSLSQPVLAGTRLGPISPVGIRAMVFRAEPYQIDLQLEAHTERNRLIITGQLLDVSRPERFAVDVPITLSNLHGTAVQTVTNQLGEFREELENSGDLELSFLNHSGKRIVILLRGALKAYSPVKQ